MTTSELKFIIHPSKQTTQHEQQQQKNPPKVLAVEGLPPFLERFTVLLKGRIVLNLPRYSL